LPQEDHLPEVLPPAMTTRGQIADDTEKWGKVIRAASIKAE
jgi:hypothetical protein